MAGKQEVLCVVLTTSRELIKQKISRRKNFILHLRLESADRQSHVLPQWRASVKGLIMNKILAVCVCVCCVSLPLNWCFQETPLAFKQPVPTLLSHFKGVLLHVVSGMAASRGKTQ